VNYVVHGAFDARRRFCEPRIACVYNHHDVIFVDMVSCSVEPGLHVRNTPMPREATLNRSHMMLSGVYYRFVGYNLSTWAAVWKHSYGS